METTDKNQEILDRMAKYLCNEMEKEERQLYEMELENSKTLKDMMEEVKPEWEKMEKMAKPPAVNVDHAWNNLRSRIGESEIDKKRNFSRMFKLAAGFLLIIGLSASTYLLYRNIQSTAIVASTGEDKKQVVLPDGSVALLNVNSSLEYPKHFNKDERNVVLIGEAYFDVTSDNEKPFIISTQNASVKVLGTSFNVYAREDGHTEVLLENGKVQMSQTANTSDILILEPGYVGKIEAGSMSSSYNQDENYMAWKTEILNFREDSLSYVFATLSHVYNTTFDVNYEELHNMRYTATITRQSIENVILALETSFDLKITSDGDVYRVTIP